MSTVLKVALGVALGVVLGFVLIMAVWILGWGVVLERQEAERNAVPPPTGLTVFLHELEQDSHSSYIAGAAQNHTGGALGFASVLFNVTDEAGRLVGTARDSTATLAAGEVWSFRARVEFSPIVGEAEGALHYELSEVVAR